MEIKYCMRTGKELPEDKFCVDCYEMYKRSYSDIRSEDEIKEMATRGGKYLLECLNNSETVKEIKYFSNSHDSPYRRYFCHNCKYINFHYFDYCPFCSNKLTRENITRADIFKKYPEYRRGY